MSVTDVKSDYDVGASAEYLVFGMGAKKRKHRAAGTNRLAPGFYCDAPSVEAFVALGHELAKRNRRKVQAQSYVLSFPPNEFDVDEPADLQLVGDAGFLLAKKMHPNSACLVVVHSDGKGRAAHAHIKVLNHDTKTGKALRDYRVHWQVKRANDELMRDLGMQVLAAQPKQPTDGWAMRRAELSEFERKLGDLCAAAKVEALTSTSTGAPLNMAEFTERFAEACQARGVELVANQHEIKSDSRTGRKRGDSAMGFTFKMRDETTPKQRIRRRKASALSSEFTHDAIAATISAGQSQLAKADVSLMQPSRTKTRRRTSSKPAAATVPDGIDGVQSNLSELDTIVQPARPPVTHVSAPSGELVEKADATTLGDDTAKTQGPKLFVPGEVMSPTQNIEMKEREEEALVVIPEPLASSHRGLLPANEREVDSTLSEPEAAARDVFAMQGINKRNRRLGLQAVSPEQYAAGQVETHRMRSRRLNHPDWFYDPDPAAAVRKDDPVLGS